MNRRTFLSYLPGLVFLGLCPKVDPEPVKTVGWRREEVVRTGCFVDEPESIRFVHELPADYGISGSLGIDEDVSFEATLDNVTSNYVAELVWNTPVEHDGLPIDEVLLRYG